MKNQLKNPHFYIIVTIDLVLFTVAYILAYAIRFDFSLEIAQESKRLVETLPLVALSKCAVFLLMGVYRGMWRYVSLSDLAHLFRAVLVSSLLIIAMLFIMYRFSGFSRGVFVLDGLLTLMLVSGVRICIRYAFQQHWIGEVNAESTKSVPHISTPILIIGAGDAGEKTLREILDNPHLFFDVRGFVDDSPVKIGKSIHGVRVFGPIDHLADFARQQVVNEVLIAIPSAADAEKRRIVELCKSCGLRFKTLPGMGEIIDNRVSIKAIRDVNYEDLLGRPPVVLQEEGI